MPFGEKKTQAQERLASAFSLDYLTVVEYEDRVQQLEAADTFDAVESLVADLPADLVPAGTGAELPSLRTSEQILEGRGQVVRKHGSWLRSNHVVVQHRGSTIRLRLDELEDLPGALLELELDVQGSMVRISVPRGTRVTEDLSGHGSTIRVTRRVERYATAAGPRLLLTGTASSSIVRVVVL